jgi:hypothetical protein
MVLTIRKSWHWLVSASLVLLGLVIFNVDPAVPKVVAKNNPNCGPGGPTYDPNTQGCCCDSSGNNCTVYDLATENCCCGTVYDFASEGCCGCAQGLYDLSTEGCCGGLIYILGLEGCCNGTTIYEIAEDSCCGGS